MFLLSELKDSKSTYILIKVKCFGVCLFGGLVTDTATPTDSS